MKTYRVYYNREMDWPQIWSVDEGTQATEINVLDYQIVGAEAFSKSIPPAERVGLDLKATPVAWIQVYGAMRVEAGIAIFTRGEH